MSKALPMTINSLKLNIALMKETFPFMKKSHMQKLNLKSATQAALDGLSSLIKTPKILGMLTSGLQLGQLRVMHGSVSQIAQRLFI